MKKIITLIIGALVAALFSASAQDLDEVLENYYEVTGMEKLSEVKNMLATGKSVQMGMETPFKNIITDEGKLYLEVPVQGQLMKQVYNGKQAWIVMPWTGSLKPTELSGPQLKGIKVQADLTGMLYNYKDKGYETKLIGTEDMEGTEVFVIEQTDSDGDVYKNYIDAENFVILKSTVKMQVQGSEVEVETVFSNYKPFEGVVMAYNIDVVMGGQVQRQLVVDSVAFNVDVDDAIFEKPEYTPEEPKEVEEKE